MLYRTALRSSRAVTGTASRGPLAPRAVQVSYRVAPSGELQLPTQLTLAPLPLRAYSAAAKLKDEETSTIPDVHFSEPKTKTAAKKAAGTDEFFAPELTDESNQTHPSRTPEAVADKGPTAATSNTSSLVPFSSLEGRMDANVLKALTFKPFNLLTMSEVQKRVLTRMPELAGGKTSAAVVEKETPEETSEREAREKRGREDLLVKAKTGTGKTIGFLVPAMEARFNQIKESASRPDASGDAQQGKARRDVTHSNVGALIISPTRELATQIANEALKLYKWHKDCQVQLLVGGENRNNQLRNFRSVRHGRKDIVVATPGRLRDLLSEPIVAEAIAKTDMLVLDEADTLLDMGFSDDLNFIVEHLPKKRQTFLFSATVSPQIEKIAHKFLDRNHSFIDCVPPNESNVHLHVPQHVTVLDSAEEQLPHLARLIAHDQLTNAGNSKIMVFLNTTKQTMLTATLLRAVARAMPEGLNVHEIHSRLSQNQRSRAADRFRRDKGASVLVTSDVSARGVDYPGVTRVIQVGIPSSPEQYVHRVGRTGRGGATGGRGDIVLLPFEDGFMDHLIKFPITPLGVDELRGEVDGLVASHPQAEHKLSTLDSKLEALLADLDPSAIEDVFFSLLGYYLAKTDMMQARTQDVLNGIKEWTTGAGGLPEPPFISPSMMAKLGLNNRSSSRRGGARAPRGQGGFSGDRDGNRGRDRRSSFGLGGGGGGSARDGPRGFGGDRGDRPPRAFGGDRGDRPPRSFGGDRPPRTFGGDREGRRPRSASFGGPDRARTPRFGGDRSDRPPRSFSAEGGRDRDRRPRRRNDDMPF